MKHLQKRNPYSKEFSKKINPWQNIKSLDYMSEEERRNLYKDEYKPRNLQP